MRVSILACCLALVSVSACSRQNTEEEAVNLIKDLEPVEMQHAYVCRVNYPAMDGGTSGYATYSSNLTDCSPEFRRTATIVEGSEYIRAGMVARLVTFETDGGHQATYLLSPQIVRAFTNRAQELEQAGYYGSGE